MHCSLLLVAVAISISLAGAGRSGLARKGQDFNSIVSSFRLPRDALQLFSSWENELGFTAGSVSFGSAVSREQYVVSRVNQGIWPAEAYDAYQVLAASTGNVDSARLMMEYGFYRSLALIYRMESNGQTNLFTTSLRCHLDLATGIIEEKGLDIIFDVLPDGTSSLMIAAFSNCAPIVSLLLAKLSSESDDMLRTHLEATGSHGLSALMVGTLHNSSECVEILLRSGADSNQHHSFAHTTLLHMASELGYTNIIAMLCAYGAEGSAKTSVGGSALHTAAQVNMAKSIEPLVSACKLRVDDLMLEDTTPLYLAAQLGHTDTVQALLSMGANVYFAMPIKTNISNGMKSLTSGSDFGSYALNSESANGATSLHVASENGHIAVVVALLQHASSTFGNDSTFSDFINSQSMGVSPLHLAAQYNRLDVAQCLLRFGAAIDLPAMLDGSTALYHALSMKHVSMSTFLVQAGSDFHYSSGHPQRTSPLIFAVMLGESFSGVLEAMVTRGIDSNHKDLSGLSVLHVSASLRDNTAFARLLDLGGDIESRNNKQETLLHCTVHSERKKNVEYLLNRFRKSGMTFENVSSYILKRDDDGYSPLHLCSMKCKRYDVLHLLMKYFPRQVSFGNCSVTPGPLHLAVARSCSRTVERLLTAGVDANEVCAGNTPLSSAVKFGHVSVAKQLIQFGASIHSNSTSSLVDHPLLLAVLHSKVDIAELLLDRGADCNVYVVMPSEDLNAEPVSLLQVAQHRRNFDMVKMLSLHPSCQHLENI